MPFDRRSDNGGQMQTAATGAHGLGSRLVLVVALSARLLHPETGLRITKSIPDANVFSGGGRLTPSPRKWTQAAHPDRKNIEKTGSDRVHFIRAVMTSIS
jgi:hypothetical protein